MGWVRVDDAFYDHPKWIESGPIAGYMNFCALAWCNRNLTDGFIPSRQVALLCSWEGIGFTWENEFGGGCNDVEPLALARMLVEVGLWHAVPGGYEIHNYLDYQRSADYIRGARNKEAERGRRRRPASEHASAVESDNMSAVDTAPDTGVESERCPPPSQPQPQEPTSSREPSARRGFEADFDTFWAGWPRKRDKGKARNAYIARRRQGVDPERLLIAAKHYAKSREGRDSNYTQHGATFLAKDGPWTEWESGVPDSDGPDWDDPANLPR